MTSKHALIFIGASVCHTGDSEKRLLKVTHMNMQTVAKMHGHSKFLTYVHTVQ